MDLNVGKPRRSSVWAWGALVGLLGAAVVGGGYYLIAGRGTAEVQGQDHAPRARGVLVEVVHPTVGGGGRTTTQPGSIHPFEWERLRAKVSGYVKTLHVDIGTRVKKGDTLLTLRVPELDAEVVQYTASLKQANARLKQMQARVDSARAELETAKATIVQAKANQKSAVARKEFRQKQYKRLKELYATRSIDERVVDESLDQYTAAIESANAAVAAIATAEAQKVAATAKIVGAEADVKEAAAQIEVVQAKLDHAKVMVSYATIKSDYDGVVTQREDGLHLGDFVRAATEGGPGLPLLTVARTDKVRVVVQVPDRDVPVTGVGEEALVEVDALPRLKFPGKVARLANAEDPDTRLMRTEIDLDNPSGKLKPGMYGRVTIFLDKQEKLLSLPSSCVVAKSEDGKGFVFVVKDGKARRAPVILGNDNGLRVAVYGGLTVKDAVIENPPPDLTDGMAIRIAPTGE